MIRFMRLVQAEPEAWSELDLTMSQLKVLLLLRARQPLTISRVSEALHVSLASASALIDRLVKLGLVRRHVDPADRRQNLVDLDAAGESMLAALESSALNRLRSIVEAMSPEGQVALALALEEMIRVATSMAADHHPVALAGSSQDSVVIPGDSHG